VQRGRHGTTSGTHFTTVEIAVEKNIFRAGVAEDVDARKAGYFFRAVTPKDYFLLQIKDADPDLQAVEDVAVNFGILKGRHGSATSSGANGFIGEEAFRLKRMALRTSVRIALKGGAVAEAAQKFRSFKGLGWWHVWGGEMARESYLQEAERVLTFLTDSSGGGLPGRSDLERGQGARYFWVAGRGFLGSRFEAVSGL
jgi:hypothetical protein